MGRLLEVVFNYVKNIVRNLLIGFNGLIKDILLDLMFGNFKSLVFLGGLSSVNSLMEENIMLL